MPTQQSGMETYFDFHRIQIMLYMKRSITVIQLISLRDAINKNEKMSPYNTVSHRGYMHVTV